MEPSYGEEFGWYNQKTQYINAKCKMSSSNIQIHVFVSIHVCTYVLVYM